MEITKLSFLFWDYNITDEEANGFYLTGGTALGRGKPHITEAIVV